MKTKSIATSLVAATSLAGILMVIPPSSTPMTIQTVRTGMDPENFLTTLHTLEPSLSLQYTINKTVGLNGEEWYHFSPMKDVLVRYTMEQTKTQQVVSESLDEFEIYYTKNEEAEAYVQTFLSTLNIGLLAEQFTQYEAGEEQVLDSFQISLQTDVLTELMETNQEEAHALKQLVQTAQIDANESLHAVKLKYK